MEIRHTIGTSTLNPIDLYPLLALTKQKTQNDLDVIEILQLRRKDEFTHLNPKTQIKKIALSEPVPEPSFYEISNLDLF